MPDAIVVMVTCGSDAEAQKIADAAVAERLAACASILGSVRSVFRWQGAVARESELLLLMKTTPERFEALSRRVKELHSYQVPEIIAVPVVAGSPDYLAWVRESTEGRAGRRGMAASLGLKSMRTSTKVLLLVVGLLAVVGLLVMGLLCFLYMQRVAPLNRFSVLAGVPVPWTARVLRSGETERGPFGDGKFWIAVHCPRDDIRHLCGAALPWQGTAWKNGPVPPEVVEEVRGYILEAPEDWVQLAERSDSVYCLEDRSPQGMPYNNVRLIIANEPAATVWFLEYDY